MADTKLMAGNTPPSICFDCARATGGCSWSTLDERGKQILFQPPEGAVVEEVPYKSGSGMWITNLRVCACPLFEPDRGYDPERPRRFNRMLDALEQGRLGPARAARENGFPDGAGYYWKAKLKKEGSLQQFKMWLPGEPDEG